MSGPFDGIIVGVCILICALFFLHVYFDIKRNKNKEGYTHRKSLLKKTKDLLSKLFNND